MTERQAAETGHRVKVSERSVSHVGRAVEKGETQGLMKLVADALSAAFFGVGGDEAVYGVSKP